MNTPTCEQLVQELEKQKQRIGHLEKLLEASHIQKEHDDRIIEILIAAGHITKDHVQLAHDLL